MNRVDPLSTQGPRKADINCFYLDTLGYYKKVPVFALEKMFEVFWRI